MRQHAFLARAAEGPVALVPARNVEIAGDVQHLLQFLRRRLVRQRRRRPHPDLRRLAQPACWLQARLAPEPGRVQR